MSPKARGKPSCELGVPRFREFLFNAKKPTVELPENQAGDIPPGALVTPFIWDIQSHSGPSRGLAGALQLDQLLEDQPVCGGSLDLSGNG